MNDQKKKAGNKKEKDKSPVREGFTVPYPFLLLTLVVALLYASSVNLDFTELDDSIFIKEQHAYNEDLSNLLTSFRRGVFNATEDVYYRPLLLDSFILNYKLSGTSIKSYHVLNILFHLVAVLLLFRLLKRLHLKELHAFLLALFFAVHPVLTPAVSWIPGRNDSLLGIFVFAFLTGVIDYAETGKLTSFVLQLIFLLCALFTKETGVFAPVVAFVLLWLIIGKRWIEKKNLILYGSWIGVVATWLIIRSFATLKNEQLPFVEILTALPSRLPVLLQYFGKIILPVNLSVFPIMRDTSYLYGIIASVVVIAFVYFSRQRNFKTITAGILAFILFLMPALLVPNTLNDQDFEHRLYLPFLGILILMGQTVLFRNGLSDLNLFLAGSTVCLVFAVINFNHQKKFKDPLTFWTAAAESSPHSAYANMMLGARLDESDLPRAQDLFKTAYELNPDEKYLNYYMGKMKLDADSIDAAEQFFLKEINISDYYECYFHMARIAFVKKDFEKAIEYLNTYLARAPEDAQANNNLLLLYLETDQTDKARDQMKKMQQLGLEIPAEAIQRLQ